MAAAAERRRALALAALLAVLPAAARADACFQVDPRQGWQGHRLPPGVIADIGWQGGWSADPAAGAPVGAEGHAGIAPDTATKHDPAYEFGALLINFNDGLGALSAVEFGLMIMTAGALRLTEPTDVWVRINDADAGLGDNAGSLQLCFIYR